LPNTGKPEKFGELFGEFAEFADKLSGGFMA
jgi:hypothetical protein